MALGDPFQILLILGVLAVILIWGPQKIPELARSIGKARKEFDDASKGLIQPPSSSSTTLSTPDSLIDTAQKLGIITQGKTRQEISDEIVRLAQKKYSDSSNQTNPPEHQNSTGGNVPALSINTWHKTSRQSIFWDPPVLMETDASHCLTRTTARKPSRYGIILANSRAVSRSGYTLS